jgi:signal transduction histidine kinase/DNA-binding response OmpR family regulator/PAS domain-containing protein/HPt (histidine-containing phosphotransfer) domain-containing protein
MINLFKKFFFRSLSRKAAFIEVLNKTIEILTSHNEKSFENVMENAIYPLADIVNLDRIVIYNKVNNEQFGQFYRWNRGTGTIPVNETLKTLPPIPIVQQWFSILSRGEKVVRRMDRMTKEEANFAGMIGIKSLVLIPVFRYGEIWGAVSFQDHMNERDFDEYFDLLNSVAYLYVHMILKEETLKNQKESIEILEHSKRMSDILNKTAVIFTSQSGESLNAKMDEGLRLVCDMVNLDRLSIWRNLSMPDGLHASQIYRWDRKSGGTTEPTHGLQDVPYVQLAPRWEKILPNNEIINGPARLMPEAAMLKSFGVVSALVVPVIVENAFWGFVLFEDRCKERYFEEDYIEIMRSTAFLCMNTFVRAEMECEILEVNKTNNLLINEASIGIVVYDHDINMIDCNVKILEMFGCTKQYFLEHFRELSPEYQPDGMNSVEKTHKIVTQALNRGKLAFEWLHKSFLGELIPCEVTLVPSNYMGRAVGLGYLYDLRKIKKAEAIVGEMQEMTKAITEASPIAYVLLDEELKAIDCNMAAMQVLACIDKQYLLDNFFEQFSAKEQPDGQSTLEKLEVIKNEIFTNTKGKYSFEWYHKTFEGELLPAEVTLSSFVFKGKKYIVSFLYDLRNHKKIMADMSEQSRLLAFRLGQQKLISDISKSFVSYGDSYTLINDALDKLGNDLIVSRLFIFCVDYERSETYVAYQWYKDYNTPKFQNNRNYDFFNMIKTKFPNKLPEGINIPVLSSADVTTSSEEELYMLKFDDVVSCINTPLYVEGSLWGVICAENCFESHEWSEDEIAFFATISSIIAGAIMRSLYEIRLKEMLNKVINLSRAKDDFLSKISHEIRNPMNAIMGITEIQLQDETLSKERREGLSIIYNSGDSLLHIINDLLDLSKLEAKKLEIVPVKYEVANLISDTTQQNIIRIGNKPIKFKLSVDEKIPSSLMGDELRIKQILNNILSNAFKYTANGEILMSVLAESYENENYDVMLIFCIKDTGQGMTEEQRNKIFDEYSRFNLSGNRSIEGTGLGMPITRNLVNLMNGEISVESELGKGSTFTVRLPQKNAGVEVLGERVSENLRNFRMVNSQMEKIQIVRDSMPYGKVLVVDDVESNLYVAKRLLDPYDLSLEVATDGLEVIEKIKSGKIYDIIFMDHMMPKMDGVEATKIIRNLGYKHPIVALTANAIVGQEEMFFENGFDGFISKPIDTRQLNNELNKFIRDKQTPEVIAKAQEESPKQSTQTIPVAVDTNLLEIFARDAKKALFVFEETLERITDATVEDLHLFCIKAHAMKSALANIGENELSQIAFTLEKAGKEQDKNTIKTLTNELMDSLKKIVEKTEKNKKFTDIDENFVYLHEQLKIVGDACANYDARTADVALAKLREMLWTHETRDVFEQISKHILLSEFEEASKLALDYSREV